MRRRRRYTHEKEEEGQRDVKDSPLQECSFHTQLLATSRSADQSKEEEEEEADRCRDDKT